MIDEIQVSNLALISNATLVPSRGLTVLTGETGAGKTALLSAMKLLMGARASSDMVRDGADHLEVSGRFFGMRVPTTQDDPASDINDFDDELVVTRRVGADGRSRASLNGSMASAKELSDVVAASIDLCGQFEHQQLMKPVNHLAIFDSWATDSISEPLAVYQAAFCEAQAAAAELKRIEEASAATSVKLDEARFILSRIDEINPQAGEYEDLRATLDRAEHAESLMTAVAGTREALSGDEGALDKLNQAADYLEQMSSVEGKFKELASSLREAGYVLEDVSAEARDYQDKIEFDPELLEQTQERFAALQGLLRAYGPTMDQVFERRESAYETVSLVDNADERKRLAQAAFDQAESALIGAADALDAARNKVAPQFAQAVTNNMARLEMSGAELICGIERLERSAWTAKSPSAIEFMYRPARGVTARPLSRIASGGEVSRVMLAIKVVLGSTDSIDTLIFDEVDAGVGGSTAIALAEVLADLSQTHQVIVVTHLAQVAVRADTHYVVSKDQVSADRLPETQLTQVTGDARVTEIARMLSGDATDVSLMHAKEMIENFS